MENKIFEGVGELNKADQTVTNFETTFLHFEDNEVSVLNEAGELISSQKYNSPKEAKAAFDKQVYALNIDQNARIEFVHFEPEFPPQRVKVLTKVEK